MIIKKKILYTSIRFQDELDVLLVKGRVKVYKEEE